MYRLRFAYIMYLNSIYLDVSLCRNAEPNICLILERAVTVHHKTKIFHWCFSCHFYISLSTNLGRLTPKPDNVKYAVLQFY